MARLLAFFVEDEAATAVEYSVILALILMTMIATIGALGQESGGLWGDNQAELESYGFGD